MYPKLLESIISNKMSTQINKWLSERHGFRASRCTVINSELLCNNVFNYFDNRLTDVVDFAKVFDKVNHSILIQNSIY